METEGSSADAGTDQPSAAKGMHKQPTRANHVLRLCFRAQDNPHSSPRYHLIQFAVYHGNRVLFGFSGCATRRAGVVTFGTMTRINEDDAACDSAGRRT
jgi:hypothetical protein